MNATATMPHAMSAGGIQYMMATKKPKADEPPRKHTFDSNDEVTGILDHIHRMGFKKTQFINHCIEVAAEQAYERLENEKKGLEQGLRRLLAKKDTAPKAP